jgi:tetratricopeptide (TPR) repeat protein
MSTDRFDSSSLRQALVLLVALKIVALILAFDPAGLQAFDLPKSLLSHALSWLLAGFIALALLRFGTAVVPRTRLHLAVAVFVAANVISAAAAGDRYLAIFGEQGRYLGLTFVLDMAVLYFAVAIAFRGAADIAVLGLAIAVATLGSLGYAAAQYAGVDPIRWSADLEPLGPQFGIPIFGTFGQPDFLGHFLSVLFAGGLAVAAAGRPFILRLGGAAFIVLALAAGIAVGTRGTVLGIAAALLALGLAAMSFRSRRLTAVRLVVPAVAAVAVLASLVLLPLGARESDAWQGLGSGRLRIYASAALAFVDRPVLGYGPDSFAVAYPRHRIDPPPLANDAQTSAHDWALQAAVTTGLVGLVALVVLLIAFARALWIALPRAPFVGLVVLLALAAYWAHAFVATGAVAVDWVPWTGFGLIAALAAPTAGRVAAQRPIPAVVLVPIVVLMVGGALVGNTAYRANEDAGTARRALAEGTIDVAIRSADAAVGRDPGRAEYWNWLGLARERAGSYAAASDAYAEATRRAQHEPTYWSNLALALARQGSAGEAISAARKAVEVDPTGWRANEVLAEVALAVGQDDLALRAAVATIVLEKGNPATEAIAADAASSVSDLAEAARLLDSALATHESAVLHVARGEIALRSTDLSTARRHATRALELDPNNAEAGRLLALSQ